MKQSLEDTVAKLRRMIEQGQYAKDGRFPPERALCEQMKVSRSTLRRALAMLEAEGLIWRHVGQGTFVGNQPSYTTLDHSPLAEMTSPAEIMEVRIIIEPKIAAMAAMRATRKEMKKMREAVLRSENASDFHENEKWDLILHEIIARSTNNHLLLTLFNTTNELRRGENWGRMKQASLTPARWKEYARQHHKLIEAIEDRNAGLAESIQRHHLESVKKNLLSSG